MKGNEKKTKKKFCPRPLEVHLHQDHQIQRSTLYQLSYLDKWIFGKKLSSADFSWNSPGFQKKKLIFKIGQILILTNSEDLIWVNINFGIFKYYHFKNFPLNNLFQMTYSNLDWRIMYLELKLHKFILTFFDKNVNV